jgi:hypothetical protein
MFPLQEDYDKYQSLCASEDMYSMAANSTFRDSEQQDLKLCQLHALLLIRACSSISIGNYKVLEHSKIILQLILAILLCWQIHLALLVVHVYM